MNTFKTINPEPFRHLIMTIGELPTSFTESMSYYECLAWLVDYVKNNIIPVINNNAEAIKKIQEWIDTLDLQDEVDNKIEEMAESGELAEIIGEHLNEEIKISDNFIVASEKVTDNVRNLEYVITRITPNTEHIDHVPLKGAFAGGSFETAADDTRVLITDIAQDYNPIVMSTADTIGAFSNRTIIRDGVAVNTNYTSDGWCIGITEDGELKCYDKTVSLDTLLNDYKIVNSWGGCVMMLEGQSRPDLWYTSDSDKNNRQPRTIIVQENDSKDIIFLHIAGRKASSNGLTYSEAVQFITDEIPNVNIAYALNSGGDVQMMIEGKIVNDCSDAVLRPLWDFIYLDANIDKNVYNNLEKELANARNTNTTMHGLLKNFLPHDFSYLAAQEIIEAKYSAATNHFVGNKDYNINLKDKDTIIVKFDDMSDADINDEVGIALNIHYNDTNAQPPIKWATSGRVVYPNQVKNKIVILEWDETNYQYLLPENGICQYFGSEKDIDELLDSGIYYSNQFTNKPGASNGWVIVIPQPLSPTTVVQIFVSRPAGSVWTRCIEEGVVGTWAKFAKEADTVLSTPEIYSTVGSKDLDDFNNGKIRVAYSYQGNNRPADAESGWIINLPRSDQNSTNYAVQLYFDRGTTNHGNMYFRQQENGTWKTWKKVVTE